MWTFFLSKRLSILRQTIFLPRPKYTSRASFICMNITYIRTWRHYYRKGL
jgi:hypothetical protein